MLDLDNLFVHFKNETMPNSVYKPCSGRFFCIKVGNCKSNRAAILLRCNIHLVHVVHFFTIPVMEADTGYTLGYNVSADMEYASKKLKQLKEQYQHHVCSGSKIEVSVLNGNPQTELKKYIEQYQMDLLIKGLSKFNLLHRIWSTVSISSLVRRTNIPVLAVRSSGLVCHSKIVLPVHDEIPMRRIRLAAALGRHLNLLFYFIGTKAVQDIIFPVERNTIIQSLPLYCSMVMLENLFR
jgi:nucleotide-binding universal stress UspA family protein